VPNSASSRKEVNAVLMRKGLNVCILGEILWCLVLYVVIEREDWLFGIVYAASTNRIKPAFNKPVVSIEIAR